MPGQGGALLATLGDLTVVGGSNLTVVEDGPGQHGLHSPPDPFLLCER